MLISRSCLFRGIHNLVPALAAPMNSYLTLRVTDSDNQLNTRRRFEKPGCNAHNYYSFVVPAPMTDRHGSLVPSLNPVGDQHTRNIRTGDATSKASVSVPP